MASLGSPTLDCFRNGSVIQLQSRVTSKTLSMQEGGLVSCEGRVGFYVGNLGPRTPVWARWTDGTYFPGIVSNVDRKVHIKFKGGDSISHDINDQTAVIADVNPDIEAIQTGSRVIAQYKGSARYYTGCVMKINREHSHDPTFHIHFDDGDNGEAHVHQIRLLPEVSTAGTPPIVLNSRVLGRWANNQYYRGIVTYFGSKIDVAFDDGDKIQYDPNNINAVIYDVNPRPGNVQVGSRVVGYWPSSRHFYIGTVGQVDYMEPCSPRYLVNFDDGDKGWCKLDEVRPLPIRRETIGCAVWALNPSNDLYYRGRVTNCSNGKLNITFNDGRDFGLTDVSHDIRDKMSVVIDTIPNPANVTVGSRVIGSFMIPIHYCVGRITQVDTANRYTPRYQVLYDNGDTFWVNFDQVRLLPTKVNEVGAVIWGLWTNNQYYKGKVERVDSKTHILFDDGDRIAHSLSDVTAVILDTTPNPGSVTKGSRVIAEWPGRSKLYPGTVKKIDDKNPYQIRYQVHYDDGDKGWVYINQLKLIPVPGPCAEAQFSVVHIGGNIVALRSIAFPRYFLGISGDRVIGKEFDQDCHFNVHETPDHYVSLNFCMFPGQYVGVNHDGELLPPANTKQSEQTFFKVKLIFSPFRQSYQSDHSYPGPTPSNPSPGYQPNGAQPGGGSYKPGGGYPQPGGDSYKPGGGYPQPGGGYPQPGRGSYPKPGGRGYAPQPGGVYPRPGGVYPQPGGGSYPPSGGNYPPATSPGQGYPPPHPAGYYPPGGGYPQSGGQGGYPQTGGGYPQPGGGYPQPRGGYPHPGGGYPPVPQPGGYPTPSAPPPVSYPTGQHPPPPSVSYQTGQHPPPPSGQGPPPPYTVGRHPPPPGSYPPTPYH